MRKTLQAGLILLVIIPGLAAFSACAKKTTTVKKETKIETDAAELERQGMSTVVIQMLRLTAEKVRPPRALVVPFRHGYPLDSPHDAAKQRAVLETALMLLEDRSL